MDLVFPNITNKIKNLMVYNLLIMKLIDLYYNLVLT